MSCRRSITSGRLLLLIISVAVAATRAPAAQSILYLHAGSTNYFLDVDSPVGTNFQTASSGAVDRTNFVEVGTWAAAPSPVSFELTSVGDLQFWLGRRFTDPNGN